MTLEGDLGRVLYSELRDHWGHEIEIAHYGDPDKPKNVSVECLDCHTVIIDANMPKEKPVTLDEFAAQVKQEVEAFEKKWRENHEKKPNGENWPLEMDEPDWYEQLIVHLQDCGRDLGDIGD